MDEEARTWLAVDAPADVPLPGGVLREEDRPRSQPPDGSVADLQLDGTRQVHHQLAPRCPMEVERIVPGHLAELNSCSGPRRRDRPRRTVIVELDGQVLEVRPTVGPSEDSHHFHGPLL